MSRLGCRRRAGSAVDLDGTLWTAVQQCCRGARRWGISEASSSRCFADSPGARDERGFFYEALERDLGTTSVPRGFAPWRCACKVCWRRNGSDPSRCRLARAAGGAFPRWACSGRSRPVGRIRLTAHPVAAVVPADVAGITRDGIGIRQAQPRPFLAASERLDMPPGDCFCGRRQHLGHACPPGEPGRWAIGLLSGGYGRRSCSTGPYRVVLDPADLLAHLDELGTATLVKAALLYPPGYR